MTIGYFPGCSLHGTAREFDQSLRELLGEQAARPAPAAAAELPSPAPLDSETIDYRQYMDLCERRLLDWALARSGGNVTVAARLLRLPRSTLRSKLES